MRVSLIVLLPYLIESIDEIEEEPKPWYAIQSQAFNLGRKGTKDWRLTATYYTV